MATSNVRTIIRFGLLAAALGLGLTAWAADDDLKKQALALNDVTGEEPMEAKLKALLKDGPGTKKLLAAARELIKDKKDPFNYNAAFVLARAAQELKEVDSADTFYKICADQATRLKSGQKMSQAFGGLIDLYYENKKFDKAVEVCQKFLELEGDETVERLKAGVRERMIQAMTRSGKIEQALKLADNLVEAEGKEGWWYLQLKGWVLREADKAADAAKVYELVLERIDQDKRLKDDTKTRYIERNRYFLSGVYVDLKQIDKAADQLKALLKDKPDNSTFNNDLGYIWADHDMNLDEAEKLIRKALDLDRKARKEIKDLPPDADKDNGAYLDSLGWVLYKKKMYAEAKKYLLQATEDKDSQHIEIYDHLGDVHLALGEKKEAVAAWKKGLDSVSATASKREQEKKTAVEKKIKDNQ